MLGETCWLKHPPWPRAIVTICVSYFITGRPGEELRTNKSPPMGKVKRRSHVSNHLPESSSLASILAEQRVHHQEGPWVRMIGQRQPGNQSHHHKTRDCEPRGTAVPWDPLLFCSPPRSPFPIKSLALSACMSPQTIHLHVLDKSPLLGPGRGPPSCKGKTRVTFYWPSLKAWQESHSPDKDSVLPLMVWPSCRLVGLWFFFYTF